MPGGSKMAWPIRSPGMNWMEAAHSAGGSTRTTGTIAHISLPASMAIRPTNRSPLRISGGQSSRPASPLTTSRTPLCNNTSAIFPHFCAITARGRLWVDHRRRLPTFNPRLLTRHAPLVSVTRSGHLDSWEMLYCPDHEDLGELDDILSRLTEGLAAVLAESPEFALAVEEA